MNYDTRGFFARLKSRKLLVLGAQWVLGALLIRYGAEHPQNQQIVSWALGALGLSGGTYHLAQAHEDANSNKLPFTENQSIGGNVAVLNNPPTNPPTPTSVPFVTQPTTGPKP